ncbi:retrovirus-related pol polyprotein from transposon TNT 1-94 [Tanacetum coccineum]
MDKSWIKLIDQQISCDGLDSVSTDYAVHNLQKTRNIDPRVNKKHIYIPCSCTKCLNHIEHKVEEVQYHLYRHGIDISYTKWTKHGEEDEPSISAPKPVNAITEFVDDIDFTYILTRYAPTRRNVKYTTLKGKYGASDKFFTELLGLIKKMLPAGNEMVEKTYQAKKVMRLMGSGYKKIHVCINNCLLTGRMEREDLRLRVELVGHQMEETRIIENHEQKGTKTFPAKYTKKIYGLVDIRPQYIGLNDTNTRDDSKTNTLVVLSILTYFASCKSLCPYDQYALNPVCLCLKLSSNKSLAESFDLMKSLSFLDKMERDTKIGIEYGT